MLAFSGTRFVGYVVYNGTNCYWCEGNSCEGWVESIAQSAIYADKYRAVRAADKSGGTVLSIYDE